MNDRGVFAAEIRVESNALAKVVRDVVSEIHACCLLLVGVCGGLAVVLVLVLVLVFLLVLESVVVVKVMVITREITSSVLIGREITPSFHRMRETSSEEILTKFRLSGWPEQTPCNPQPTDWMRGYSEYSYCARGTSHEVILGF